MDEKNKLQRQSFMLVCNICGDKINIKKINIRIKKKIRYE